MKFLCFGLLAITVFLKLLVPTIADPDGFLNIICGASKNQTASDDLYWVTDSPYINVSGRYNATLDDKLLYLPFRSISYFTNLSQKKYCYLLPVEPEAHYLVRASFIYQDFISRVKKLANMFDLLIGGIKWTSLNLSSSARPEIILAAMSDRLSLCLARNSQTQTGHYVFISSIELRRLDNSVYKAKDADVDNKALALILRTNFGGETISYRDNKLDPYDRIWTGSKNYNDLSISDYLQTEGLPINNSVPQRVLQTAVSAYQNEVVDVSYAFANSYSSLSPGSYYFLFYFCNISRSSTSTFQVVINGNGRTDWIQTNYGQCKFLDHYLDLETNDNGMRVILNGTGPFINGAELYKILDVQNTNHDDVLAIREIAGAINAPADWSGADPCLPSNYSSTGIHCSNENRVTRINLTNMGLVGEIPRSISKLTELTELLLGNNNLSGGIPEDLSSLKNLKILYLENNHLRGTVPRGLVKPGLDLRVDRELKFPAHKRESWRESWFISVGCSVLLVLVVTIIALIWRQRHPSQPPSFDMEAEAQNSSAAVGYEGKDIRAATENYNKVITQESLGSVFRGNLSGLEVVVKVLSDASIKDQPEFHKTLSLLSSMNHRNLVNIVGYCRQPVQLIYEYTQYSLQDHLDGKAEALGWHSRLNIALQAAEGLLYLHHECKVIHGDIKCSNILLDTNMCAKLADFRLYKLVERSKSYVSTNVKGTSDYMDPEYPATSALTEKSDVYSFGVVLLKIISGKFPKDGTVQSVRQLLSSGKVEDLIDPSLGDQYNLPSANKVSEIACACTEPKSTKRPQMSVIVKELKDAEALPQEDVNRFVLSIEGDPSNAT